MTNKHLLVSLISVGILLSGLFFTSRININTTSIYQSKRLSFFDKNSSDGGEQWLKARYLDLSTGLPVTEQVLGQIQQSIHKMKISKNISFLEQGPDNIGGRTRAIQPDRTNINRVWAGGVSGGLFVSLNKGNQWSRVDEYIAAGASAGISSMTQTPDGTFFVATGSNQEGFGGNGVWYTTDFGLTWEKIPGLTNCTEIASSNIDNWVYLATPLGLRKWKLGDSSITTVPVSSGGCFALQVSKDGGVIITSFGPSKIFVSTNGGLSFSDKSGTDANNLVPTGASRIEFAISPIKNSTNKHSLYVVRTNSSLLSMHVSHDDGQTWNQFVGASGPPNEFDIFRDQGTYNSIVTVKPTDTESILIGGIDVWKWTQTVNNPPSGGFEKISQWFLNQNSPVYVHADNHEMKWDANNRLYVGNDGGVNVSNNFGGVWYPTNRGYNVTQFYGIAFDRDGSVMGGAQDNGTLYNDHTMSTFQQFREIGGGDGFECEISHFNPSVMFSCVYYNSIRRSGDRGATSTSFEPNLPNSYADPGTPGSIHPFHTEFVLSENYDLNSKDSVNFIVTKNYEIGDIIRVPSTSSGDTMTVIANTNLYFDDTLIYNPALTVGATNYGQNSITGETIEMGQETVIYNVSWDTLRVQDPYQSWFLVYVNINGGELWGTRNALRLSTTFVNWVCVAKGIGAGNFNNIDIEFSKDLDNCYVSAGSGVWRIDGLGSVYTSDPLFNSKVSYSGLGANATVPTSTTATKITTTSYEGLAINPLNANDIVLFSGFNGVNRRSLNATSTVPSFTALGAITNPGVACYDGIIDRDDSDIIVVGTSNGVFVTENGGASWSNSSSGFEGTPVFEVRQSWRTFEEGNNRPGEIWIGTYGRGIWSSAAYLALGDNESTTVAPKTKMKVIPNPVSNSTTLSFNLIKSGTVIINVYSITGRLIKTSTQSGSAGENMLYLELEGLMDGTYIIKLASGKQVESAKFIKL